MLVLGEENFKDICCNEMIQALKDEEFYVETDGKFGYSQIQFSEVNYEYLSGKFKQVHFCPFCSTKIEYIKAPVI